MYLDPAGIPRAARWYHPETRKELHAWPEIIAKLAVDEGERDAIRLALRRFRTQMIGLDVHMRQAGFDDDIVAFLTPHIATQVQQLLALGGPAHGTA